MVDVFISYSRTDKDRVAQIARAIEAEGYAVWWDAELPPHQSYGEVITAKIESAGAALVVWSKEAAASEWVRAEADAARNHKKLIQTSLGEIIPPLPFNQIQCADLGDWNGQPDHDGWRKVKQSLVALCGERQTAKPAAPATEGAAPPPPAPPPAAPLQPTVSPDVPFHLKHSQPPPSRGLSNRTALIICGIAGAVVLGLVVLAGIGSLGTQPSTTAIGSSADTTAAGLMGPGGGAPAPAPAPAPTVAASAAPQGDGLNRDITLVNATGEIIMYLYWSNTGEADWGPDRLGSSEVLGAGRNWSVTVDDSSGACNFDFMARTESQREIVRQNVNVCGVYEVRFE